MSAVLHGGPDASGAAPHDFSTNGNAVGACPAVLSALRVVDAARYPDPQYTALRSRLAAFHGVKAARIVIAASASEFIHRISAAVAQGGGRCVWLPAHSYGDYERAAQAWVLQTIRAPQAYSDAALRWCCEPSSPLGQPQADLPQLAASPGGACVLDLAYEPLRLEGQASLDATQRDRLWQLWTPNKAMGLTGIRAAYAVAPEDADASLVQRIERLAPSWPLGAHGVAMLEAWTGDEAQRWLAQSLQTLRDWKNRQRAVCESLGWQCLPSDANFFCARTDRPYPDVAAALRTEGIKLRDCTSFGLPGHVRLGVLPPASQQALKQAWTNTS
ncbi:aminotransferase class I/II-fold pyridoxal phosphate-dependent enzyme [Variovorax sp. Varisp85]|uniref:aminotransferase class I/II-fold pyridoxal phosphate-dependent enzyme n=1 Tax=unclassified Variovorax TaxID=663243 RepID=UPI000270FB51|nr:aminotransferase class I/II-fold pyridoxal phosphate-dependent enzyme [Variovorax sp. CF313]EJL70708.1 PLP-dependent enzyme, histidinol-phosphate/aromatic aminotransferase or cobyric acid decarboxylase [Variovorax sp. CF313]